MFFFFFTDEGIVAQSHISSDCVVVDFEPSSI